MTTLLISILIMGVCTIGALVLVDKLVGTAQICEYEAAVSVRRGRVIGRVPTGRHFYLHALEELHVFDLREKLLTVPAQEILTADGVAVKLTLILSWKVVDPVAVLTSSENYYASLYAVTQLALREAVARCELDQLLSDRGDLTEGMLEPVRTQLAAQGLGVERISLKDLMVSGDLKRAMAETARARAEARAQLERTRGETAALRSLTNAAQLLEKHTGLYQLRMLETAKSAAEHERNTLVLGLKENPLSENTG